MYFENNKKIYLAKNGAPKKTLGALDSLVQCLGAREHNNQALHCIDAL